LAASGAVVDETKDDYKQQPHCDTSSRSKHNSVPNPPSHLHDDHHIDVDVEEDVDANSHMDNGVVKMRRHSHDNHYDRIPQSNSTTITTRPKNDRQSQDTGDIEQGAEPDLEGYADEDSDESGENVKTAKLARTQSCVSWTKVVQKFKNILGKIFWGCHKNRAALKLLHQYTFNANFALVDFCGTYIQCVIPKRLVLFMTESELLQKISTHNT